MDDRRTTGGMGETGAQLFEDLMRFRPDGLSPNAWAVKARVSRTVWQDLKRHGNPSRRTLEKLLTAAGSSLAEFEALRVGHVSPACDDEITGGVAESGSGYLADLPTIPLVSCLSAGDWAAGIAQVEVDQANVIDRVPRPHGVAKDAGAFALTVPDDAMWPRFRPGRRILVSPNAPIQPGDDVLVMIASPEKSDPTLALIKELVGRSPHSLKLRQFTPATTFDLPVRLVYSTHKILGELI